VLRCVDVLASSHAMLPTRLVDQTTMEDATDHPLYELIRWQPNDQHTAFEFYHLMDVRRLLHGNAYAVVIRGVGGRPIALQPIDPLSVTVQQMPDWSLKYMISLPGGRSTEWPAADMLHVRDLSINGIIGEGRAKLAAEALRVARKAEVAQSRIFENGMMSGGTLSHPQKLGPVAYARLQDSMESRYAGVDNAGRWILLEEGMKAERFSMTGQEAQTVEARNHQIEEVARAFGVPRPFLMMDDTSWGSASSSWRSCSFASGSIRASLPGSRPCGACCSSPLSASSTASTSTSTSCFAAPWPTRPNSSARLWPATRGSSRTRFATRPDIARFLAGTS
jgi:HK97 family phage portal protein